MTQRSVFFAVIFAVVAFALPAIDSLHAQNLAPTPPMGWNSWDAYGFTIDESDFKANVTVLAGMKQYGWSYAVIDEGWYMADPFGANLEARKYLWDGNGYLIPVEKRFPSSANGAGFKPLADWVHAQGLKFGIHIVRGIPRQVVKDNLPIAGSSFHAADVADMDSPCPWDEGNWGVKDNAAGQAYYDGMLKLYASWGLDFIKVDCISDRPYRITEIKQIAEAIKKTGRPIVLSLSPGPTNLQHAAEVAKYAQMWRIADDHWDLWAGNHKAGESEFPFGVKDEFDRLAAWAPYAKPGGWPDADMLPEGSLTPHPGWGDPRQSRYTQDEQRTEFTLWAISRSPLIYGGNLTKLDDFTRALMTNRDVMEIDQKASSVPIENLFELNNKSATKLLIKDMPGFEHIRIWQATILRSSPDEDVYYAFFNLDDKPATLNVAWSQLLGTPDKQTAWNVWERTKLKQSNTLEMDLPAHGCALYRTRVRINVTM